MTGEDGLRIGGGEDVERFEGAVGVFGEGAADDLRADAAARHVEGDERVAAEQQRAVLEEQGAASGGMPRSMDHSRSSRDCEDLALGELVELRDRRRSCDAVGQDVQEVTEIPGVTEERHDARVAHSLLAAEVRGVGAVGEDAGTGGAQALGVARVIGVVVGDEHRVDVVRRSPEPREAEAKSLQ